MYILGQKFRFRWFKSRDQYCTKVFMGDNVGLNPIFKHSKWYLLCQHECSKSSNFELLLCSVRDYSAQCNIHSFQWFFLLAFYVHALFAHREVFSTSTSDMQLQAHNCNLLHYFLYDFIEQVCHNATHSLNMLMKHSLCVQRKDCMTSTLWIKWIYACILCTLSNTAMLAVLGKEWNWKNNKKNASMYMGYKL